MVTEPGAIVQTAFTRPCMDLNPEQTLTLFFLAVN